jgi:hypothetical protein
MNGYLVTFWVILISTVSVVLIALVLSNHQANNAEHIKQLGAHLDSTISGALAKHYGNIEVVDILQSRDELGSKDDGATYDVKRTIIARNQEGAYILGIFYSDQSPHLLQSINEIRARRALFLWPEDYKKAFGESPNRLQILALQKLSEKLDRFDSSLHGSDKHEEIAVGKEFGAKAK